MVNSARPPAAVRADGGSRADYVYSTIRAAIHEGQFQPGDRLRETDVAEWLGVSRTPVREALRRLKSDGLLIFAPPRGLVVPELDQQQVHELYALREFLEGLAARLAAQHASDAEVHALRDLLSRETEAPESDPATLAQINKNFHQLIYRAARNRYLLGTLNSLRDAEALLRSTTFAVPGRPASAYKEHLEILRAIENRDMETAEAAARAHIRAAGAARLVLLFQ